MNTVWNNVRMFLWMTCLTGIIYPLLITAFAQITMKHKADGGFITSKETIVGATLIAQKFVSDRYFWPRPSAIDYNPLPSGASNLGPTSFALKKAVEIRKGNILETYHVEQKEIPAELLFASGSGLDPHISLATAYFQMDRVAKSRGLKSVDIKNLIDKLAIKKSLGLFGEACINVLQLNMALDALSPEKNPLASKRL